MSRQFDIKGTQSIENSTIIPIASLGNFAGVAELNDYPDVLIQTDTDQNGTLYFEFSSNGVDWDTSLSFNYDTNRINPPHIFVKGSRYFRVRFISSSALDQTYIRLYTYYGSFNKLTAPINGTLAESYDAIATRPTEFHNEVAMSKRQGHTTWNKFGYNDDVDTSGEEIIASWGGTYTPPTIAETLTISSTSGNDIVTTGTGLNAIVITGIDANRVSQVEVVNMNGTSDVVTTSTWLGINRVSPFLCGTGLANAGTINITNTISGDTLAQMPIGKTVSQQSIFHVQDNHTFLTSWLHINALKLSGGGGSPEVTVRGYVFSPVANSNIMIFKTKLDTLVSNTVDINPYEPFPVSENSVLYFTAETDINNTSIDIRFSGIEARNS